MSAHSGVTRTWATLRIWAKSLDPDTVTLRLGIGPSDSFKAGDHRGKDGRNIWKHGRWALTSQEIVVSTDLVKHIEWVLDQIEPVREHLRELMQQPGVRADLFCFWETESINPGIEFSPAVMERVAALNLPIGIDIYFAF